MIDKIKMSEYFSHMDILDNKDVMRETTVDTLTFLPKYMNQIVGTHNENDYKNVEIIGEVYIGSNVTIDSFTKIIGPVIINNNVEISSNVLIRPNTIIGSDVKIGHGSEIKNSIIMNGAKVATNVFVGDSIVGYKTRLGSGTITTNRRFDQHAIRPHDYNTKESIDSNLMFFGAIIGDESRVGANSTLMPGIHIGHDTFVASNVCCGGMIPSDVLVDNQDYKNLNIVSKEKIDLV